jgi:ABC-type antimicrobial peptide transport system permease subunit
LSALAGRQHLIFAVASTLSLALGITALVICAIGLYGVVRFNVISRTREISVRMAVGARPMEMVRLLISDALRHVRWGVGLGLPLCLLFSLMLRTAFGAAAFSVLAYLTALLALLLMCVITASFPAREVLRFKALDALRGD